MYTRCPHCLTVFMLGAEQLKAAHGNVRCGTCLESFDAIPHLSDGPLQDRLVAADHSSAAADASADPDARADRVEPRGDAGSATGTGRSASERLSSTLDAVRAAAAVDASKSPSAAAGGASASADRAEPREARDEDPPSPPTATVIQGNTSAQARVAVLDAAEDDAEDTAAELPEILRADAQAYSAQTAARRRAIGYGSAAIALLALLAAQYLFFMPEDAARRYPQFRGAIESVCVEIGCVMPERRDPSRIRVLSRDVRVHPRYEGVMQIKATLTNAAPFRQPYPQVRFTLFNVNGQTIATRVFAPSEYLGRAVAAGARLRPKTPFQMALDVLAPGEAAVSFELEFL